MVAVDPAFAEPPPPQYRRSPFVPNSRELGAAYYRSSASSRASSQDRRAMGPSQQCRGVLDLEALAPAIAVDHGITLHNYFRIADSILTQPREEKNFIQLYVLLLRYSSLLCETIPKHRDYRAFKSIKKDFFKKKLLDVLNELESLKPVVQKKFTESDLGATEEPHCLNRTYAASCRTDEHFSDSYTPQEELDEAFAIVLAPSKESKKDREKIFQLTDPGGMRAIGDCDQRSFHPHDLANLQGMLSHKAEIGSSFSCH